MSWKRRWLLLLSLAGALAFAGCAVLHDRGTYYEGKSIGYWFGKYCGGWNNGREDEAVDAFCKLGTNALPYLVSKALSTPGYIISGSNLYPLLEKLPDKWYLEDSVAPYSMGELAVEAIREINPSAAVILPYVNDALNSGNPLRYHRAIEILARVETNTALLVPYFGKALHVKDRDPLLHSRAVALSSLRYLGTNTLPALPDLLWLLNDYSKPEFTFVDLACCLGNLGTNAVAAIPRLHIGFQNEPDWACKCEIASALCRIDELQTNALQFLIAGLKQPDQEMRIRTIGGGGGPTLIIREPQREFRASFAAWQIGLAGPNAQAAVPALVEAMSGTNFVLRTYAPYALFKVGAPRALYFPKLKEGLKSTDEFEPMSAAYLILCMDPYDAESRGVMAKLVKTHSRLERLGLRTLIELPGPLDDDTTEAVNRALASGDDLWVHLVKDSLERHEQRH